MTIKKIVHALLVISFSFILIEGIDQSVVLKDKIKLKEYYSRIASDAADRFEIFFKAHISVGLTLIDIYESRKSDYGKHINDLIQLNQEYVGVNIVDANGRIIQVFPEELNKNTIGKISQNYIFLKNEAQHSNYWVSSVFDLYQGGKGIALYFPVKKNQQTRAWVAIVLDANIVFNQLRSFEFLKNAEISIEDPITHTSYFQSGILPDEKSAILAQSTVDVLGRNFNLRVWPKDYVENIVFIPKYLKFIFIAFLSLIGLIALKIFNQHKTAKGKLFDIGVMLKLTTKDIINRFIDRNLSENEKDIFISNLLEQINLLKTMSEEDDQLEEKNLVILDLIAQQKELFQEVIQRKNIRFSINHNNFKGLVYKANEWLVQNGLITNIMLHLLKNSQDNSQISIDHEFRSNMHYFFFQNDLPIENTDNDPFILNRRLEVANSIAGLYRGQFFLSKGPLGELKITLVLPDSN